MHRDLLPGPRPTRYTRRRLLGLAGGALLAAACGGSTGGAPQSSRAREVATALPLAPLAPTVRPTATPRPVPPAGRELRTLLAGSEYATTAMLSHSGIEGPRVLVLGGVHGNEPGGWLAAEAIADWTVTRGSLVVVPRANVLATYAFARTLDGFGDLNRQYPGAEDGPPMARMARAIVDLAREVNADLAVDMHESWGFYRERTPDQSGTAFIGQTVTAVGSLTQRNAIRDTVDRVNELLSEREQLTFRNRTWGRGRAFAVDPNFDGIGASSLSLGTFVPGLLPILVEMGQRDQPEERRAEIHRTIVSALLTEREML